jgi:hypothetical protein
MNRTLLHIAAMLGVTAAVALACFIPGAQASRNSSGTYSLPAGNPVVSGTTVSTTWANNTLGDISTELTNSLDRSGRGGMTGQFKASSGTVNLPGIAFSSDTNSGLYRVGSHDLAMSVNATKVVDYQAGAVTVTGTLETSGNATVDSDLTVNAGTHLLGATTVSGSGQNTATPVTNSSLGGAITLNDTNGLTNNGGMLVFGFTNLGFAAIKGLATSGAGNGAGDLAIATRNATGDSTLTERLRIGGASGGITTKTPLTIGVGGTQITASYGAGYSIDFPNTASGLCASSTQTLTGAAVGGVCMVSPDAELGGGGHLNITTYCAITAADTVKVFWCNASGSTIDPAAGPFRVRVFQF